MSGRLPNETGARFALLVFGAFAAAASIADALWFGLYLDESKETMRACAIQFPYDLAAQSACRLPQARQRVLWTLGIGALVILLALACGGIASAVRRRTLESYPRDATIDSAVVVPTLALLGSRVPKLL